MERSGHRLDLLQDPERVKALSPAAVEASDVLNRSRGVLDFAGSAINTRRAVDKFLVTVFGAFAGFERNLMLDRQREAIAKAKAEGKYKGRKPTARAKADQVRPMAREGLTKARIAERLGDQPT